MAAGWVDYWRRGWGWLSNRTAQAVSYTIDHAQEIDARPRRTSCESERRDWAIESQMRQSAFTPREERI